MNEDLVNWSRIFSHVLDKICCWKEKDYKCAARRNFKRNCLLQYVADVKELRELEYDFQFCVMKKEKCMPSSCVSSASFCFHELFWSISFADKYMFTLTYQCTQLLLHVHVIFTYLLPSRCVRCAHNTWHTPVIPSLSKDRCNRKDKRICL